MQMEIGGVFAALLTPRRSNDDVDVPALQSLVEFLVRRGISSFVANGATGEFCLSTPADLQILLRTVRKSAGASARLLCGVGGPSLAKVLDLARVASDEGAEALLVPTPYFFTYEQEDLEAFYESVATHVSLPVILYNLPQFASGLLPDTACRLIRDVPNIVGIKDSSGSLAILQSLTSANIRCSRVIGNDGVLAEGVRRGLCDGVVSGVACVLPELVRRVFELSGTGGPIGARAEELLKEFIGVIERFPVPWGLRWGLEARGVLKSWSAQPVSPGRAEGAAEMVAWFHRWHEAVPNQIEG